jgi:hypothetical protein
MRRGVQGSSWMDQEPGEVIHPQKMTWLASHCKNIHKMDIHLINYNVLND